MRIKHKQGEHRMISTQIKKTVILIALASLVAPLSSRAGDLTPPPGPVAPTMKPLSQIEPRTPISATTTPGDSTCVFRITQSGAHYLTGNITVPVGKNGILIANAQVTLDL